MKENPVLGLTVHIYLFFFSFLVLNQEFEKCLQFNPFKRMQCYQVTKFSLCSTKGNLHQVQFVQPFLRSELQTFHKFLICAQEEFRHLSCLQQLYVSSSEANIILS